MVDLGSWRRMVEGLQAGDVGELVFQEAVDPVEAVLSLGGEDVEVAGDGEVLVLVAGEDPPLEVNHEPKSCQEIGPENGLLDVGDLEIPGLPPAGELQGDEPGPIAVDPGSAGTDQVVPRV